jgi:predicted cupin superfamily sugar epimerase
MMQGDKLSASKLIEIFGMELMETENIHFVQSWVSSVSDSGGKPAGTAIVALLTDDENSFSDLHQLPTDEIWHFYLGDPIDLLLLYPDGKDEVRVLGHALLGGQHIQTVVPAGVWMGAKLRLGGTFGLFGNTMAPGYTLEDFVPARLEELVAKYPQRRTMIESMIRK